MHSVDAGNVVGSATRLSAWRWLLLAIFPLGYLSTAGQLGAERTAYLGWHINAFSACFLLLLRLRSFAAYYWPVWLGLAAFLLGYFLKFYALVALAVRPTLTVTIVVTSERLQLAGNPDVAIEAFRIAVLSFCIYCGVFFVSLRPLGSDHVPMDSRTLQRLHVPLRTIWRLGAALLLVTTAVALSLGILSMAEAQQRLPFRLGGWIMYSRVALLTTLALVLVQFGLKNNMRRWSGGGLILLLGLGITDTLIRTSRGALLLTGIMIMLIIALTSQRISRRMIVGFVAFAGLTIVLYPIITAYRYLNRLTDGGASIALLRDAVATAAEDGGGVGLAAFQMLQRFIGVDVLLFLTEPTTWPGLGGIGAVRQQYGSVAAYLTRSVVGIPDTVVFSEAPSLVGWFLMVGGMTGILLLFPLFLAVLWIVWVRLWRSSLLIKSAAQVQLLVLWLTLSSEGTLDSMTLHIFAVLASLAVVEVWLRHSLKTRLAAAPAFAGPMDASAPAT